MPFQKLFEPGRIGTLDIKNRIVMPAMASISAAREGFPTDLTKDYYEARARGGAGLIIVGSLCVDYPVGLAGKPRLAIHDDKFIAPLGEIAAVIHKHGAKAAAQLNHAGNTALQNLSGLQPVAPSALLRRTNYTRPIYFMPRALSVSEIRETVAKFAQAAGRCQKAGLDGIEVHAGHAYLLSNFLSPYWNRRQDEYGGDLRNRARFLLEVISAIRATVGPDFPVWCRINARETDVEGGTTLDMAKELALMLEQAGVAAVHVTVSGGAVVACSPGYVIDLAAEIKKVVSVPVMTVGRIDCQRGEKVLRQKKADFIAMARALVADPELPNKAASGRVEDIVPCQYCNTCLSAPMELQAREGLRECAVNAALTKEREYEIKPAQKRKKVLVVGGGPGGMEAARVAALRGHQVALYEKERRLGGKLILAGMLRKESRDLNEYLSGQIRKLGIKVALGKVVDPALITEIRPDAVVLATGAASALPAIPGIDRDNVLSGADVESLMHGRLSRGEGKHQVGWRRHLWHAGLSLARFRFGRLALERLMRFWMPLGKRVIVVGRGLPGIELAHFLLERGKRVTIVDTREDVPFGEPPMAVLRQYLEWRLGAKGVAILTATEYEGITDKGLTIINKKGQRQLIEGDTMVFAADYRPNAELGEALAGMPFEVYRVGDCAKPVGILEAICDGASIGRAI